MGHWFIGTAFGVGILGSLHCLGMCGPLALALPRGAGGRAMLVLGRALYNGGRVLTYMLLGAAAGAVGQTLAFAGAQRALSIAAGACLLLAAAAMWGQRPALRVPALDRGVAFVKAKLGALLRERGRPAFLLIGILNGFLPCGLVVVALAGAAATGSVAGGIAYMGLFGLGTVPMMLAVSLSGPALGARVRAPLRRVTPYALAGLAALLLWRGFAGPEGCPACAAPEAAPVAPPEVTAPAAPPPCCAGHPN